MNTSINMQLNRQDGAALITALVFLVILTLLAITSISTTTLEEKMAANSQEINRVFQASETGLGLAFADNLSFNTANTVTAPYTQGPTPVGTTGTNMTYSSWFRDPPTEPPRGSGYEVGTAAAYHFNLRGVASNDSGANQNLDQGAFQIGPAL